MISGLSSRLVIAYAVVLLTGCAGTWQQRTRTGLEVARESVKAASAIAHPILHARCVSAAETCRAANDRVCEPMVRCLAIGHNFDQVVLACHAAILDGLLAVQAMSEPDAAASVAKALELAGRVAKQLESIR